jgi:spermidine synthase
MPASSPATVRWLLPVVCAVFFGSGFAALVYQVVWLRSLSLVFGVTVHAASTVLAGFMAGLAIGSALAGRLSLSPRQALAVFALIELGVGATALIAVPLVGWMTEGYAALGPHLPESLALLTVVRFLMASAALVVPTSLMGATLPVLVRATGADPRVGARLSALYATNTAGAILGALLTGFVLVPQLGLRWSAWLAAGVNLSVAMVALAVRARMADEQVDSARDDVSGHTADEGVAEADGPTRATVLAVFAASGFVSLALEIIWFRVLALHLRPTAYAFTIMLAAVLAGISLGSYLVTPLFRRPRPWLAVLASIQLALALVAVLSLNWLPAVPAVQAVVGPVLAALGVHEYVWPLATTSLLSILPASLLLGAAFPIGLRIVVGRAVHDASRRVALFYSLNVCGAILGSVLAGFFLLPWFGSRGALVAVAAVTLVSSLALAYRLWPTAPNVAGFLSIVGPVAFLMSSLNSVDPFDDFVRRSHRTERLMWLGEGVQTTVSVLQQRTGVRVMYLDGMHQADDSRQSRLTHQRIGALPMMLHPNPKRVLVVGLGGGATPGAAAMFPGAEVDVVELSKDVVDGAAFFGHINFDVLTRPNVRLRVDDGRNYLLTTTTKYDVITADLILPNRAGATSLYSRQYFELVRRTLAPGGIVLQWLGSDTDFEYKLILRTFLSVFPNTTAWAGGSLLAGTLEPYTMSAAHFASRRTDPRFRTVFDWDLETLRQLYTAGPAALAAFVGPGPMLSDDRPIPEYFLSLPTPNPAISFDGLTGSMDEILRP